RRRPRDRTRHAAGRGVGLQCRGDDAHARNPCLSPAPEDRARSGKGRDPGDRTGRIPAAAMSGAGSAPSAADLIIVSAADSGYFPLLRYMVASVRALRRSAPLGVLDVGLVEAERIWLHEQAVQLVRPDWDIAFPQQDRTPETLKALVSRPFLPRHFP